MESNVISRQIVNVRNNTSNDLVFYEEKFETGISNLRGSNKLLVMGAVGKMRVGKSSAQNNFLTLLTGKCHRPFSDLECIETDTRGIHIISIEWEEILQEYKEKLFENFGEKVDVILIDCEGTESSNNVGTSRLYLLNMLINSVIHIHVSKALDQNFATKLSQALVSSNQILEKLGGNVKEILPALYILIKDTTKVAWENAKRADPTLTKYEDLIKKYENLLNYFEQFPSREIEIIPPPPIDEETGSHIVNNKNSLYWKSLEAIFHRSIQHKKLKTKNELVEFIKNLTKIINEDDLMNVKSELDNFYQSMFNKEKYGLLKRIITKAVEGFSNFLTFSLDEMRQSIINIAQQEIATFNNNVANISCKWIFQNLEADIQKELNQILTSLEDLYCRKKEEYLLQREITKKNENVYEDKVEDRKEYEVVSNHASYVYMYPCCESTNQNHPGCVNYTETSVKQGNAIVRTLSFGLFGNDKIKVHERSRHVKPWGEFCTNCIKPRGSRDCINEVKTNIKQYTETVLTGINQIYTMEEWKDNDFKNDAVGYFMNKINSI